MEKNVFIVNGFSSFTDRFLQSAKCSASFKPRKVSMPKGCIINMACSRIKNANNSKLIKYTNRTLSAIPATAMTLTALGAGIIAGNKVSNFINEKVYKQKVDRDIKATDFAPHVDDLCLAVSLIASESSIGNAISKLVPFALLVAGNEVGKAQEKTIS